MSQIATQSPKMSAAASLLRPLRVPTFRNLIVADVVSDIGTFMQSVAAAWLMVSLNAGPIYVALTQTASSLPYFLLALPAGSAGDIFDRRKLVLATETWMVTIALLIAVFTLLGLMSPWLLLVLTFALSAGDAFEAPAWRAILPDLVAKDDFAAASALNGIEFNLARAIGPGLAGVVVATAGVAAAFVANFFSFFGVIVVVARWKRPTSQRTTPPETLGGATSAAIRYVRNSPGIINILVRTAAVLFCSSALFALLPALAKSVNSSAIGYGLLLGSFGIGAILGAFLMQWARARWRTEAIVSSGIITLGAATIAASGLGPLWALAPAMLIGGAAWVAFISLINGLIQDLAAEWVRARVLAMFILVYQGSFALGSAACGALAQRIGVRPAFFWAGAATAATAVLAFFFKLPEHSPDMSPWRHWRKPVLMTGMELNSPAGPVLVYISYNVVPKQEAAFIQAIHAYGRVRRRDGAFRWAVYRDTEAANRFVEAFLVHSWDEHLRQHERQTQADRELEQRIQGCIVGGPEVHHLLSV